MIGKIIGNTPMIQIFYEYRQQEQFIYAKLEYYNLTGSIKDRVAYYILTKAKKEGKLKEGMPIVEATSGNTGISLAALGAYYHHPVHIFMPDWASQERVKLMESFGANITLISKEEGGFKKCVAEAKKWEEEQQAFLVNQFANWDNIMAHYETTGEEIVKQIPTEIGGFVSGIGTGGTLMGTGKKIRKVYDDAKIIAIEPESMPLIAKGQILGPHKIEGIGDDFIPDLVDRNAIDQIYLISDEDAIQMARKIAKELGIGVGISSGANFLGAVLANETSKHPLVTVFVDDNKKYLSTDLTKAMDLQPHRIANQIRLLRYEIVPEKPQNEYIKN